MPDQEAMKRKILHVHDVAFVGSTLVAGLHENGEDARLYTFMNYSNPRLPKIIGMMITVALRFLEIFRLGSFLRKEKIDIIHVHYGSFAYLALLNRVPFFLHIHGTDVRSFIHWPVLGAIIRQGIKKAKAVFYSTPDLKQLLESYRPDAIFIPNPVDVEKFKPGNNSTDICPTIFNINKIDRFKGLEQVLKTLDRVLESGRNIQVVMFGFGNAFAEAQGFISKYKDDLRLKISPRVSHEEMIELIQRSTIVLGQMETGALGCSELEAIACGKPVVCSFSYSHVYPSPPPILNADDAEEAYHHIIRLIDNLSLTEQLGDDARNWAVTHHDKRVIARNLLETYQRKM